MGEEADLIHFDDDDGNGDTDGVSVLDWEVGLPTADELTPLSQPLVPPELASAFGIRPEPAATILDVHRASQATLSSILNASGGAEDPSPDNDSNPPPPPTAPEEEERSARALKRPRLVWTPQLHRRFVEVVAHLGIKNAVPKTIMQLMNVEGLTRENVASHLQKYRLYLKRMSGLSNEGPSASDPIFASTPVPDDLMTAQQQLVQPMSMMQGKHVPVPMPYAVPTMIPMHMPVYGMHHYGYDGNYHHQQQHHAFGGYGEQRGKDWASGSKFGNGSVVSCRHPHRVTSNDK